MVKKILEKVSIVFLAALFSLLTGYFLLSRTEKGNSLLNKEQTIERKIDGKADKGYVDDQDEALEKMIDGNKDDNELAHQELREDINDGFKELREGQVKNTDRIIDVINER